MNNNVHSIHYAKLRIRRNTSARSRGTRLLKRAVSENEKYDRQYNDVITKSSTNIESGAKHHNPNPHTNIEKRRRDQIGENETNTNQREQTSKTENEQQKWR